MRYLINKYTSFDEAFFSVVTTINDIDFVSFPAEIGNTNYDAFLVQAKLTNKQVHSLTPDIWYDFPAQEA